MKKILITLLIALGYTIKGYCQENNALKDFGRHLLTNYQVPKVFSKDCYFNYLAVVVSPDNQNKISAIKVINEADEKLIKSLQFLKGYKFSSIPNLKKGPILFFLVFDWGNEEIPGCESSFILGVKTPAAIFGFGLADIAKQLKVDPNTAVIYYPMIVGMSKPKY